MSGHGHHDEAASEYEAHDDHHETSSDDFPADEPSSPGWLPLLGGALFLAGILAFFVFSGDDTATDGATAAAAPAPPSPTAVPALAGAAAAAARPAMRLPAGLVPPGGRAPGAQP